MPSANMLRTYDGSGTTDTVLPNKVISKYRGCIYTRRTADAACKIIHHVLGK